MIKNISLLFFSLFGLHLSAISQCVANTSIYSFNTNGKTYEIIKEPKSWSDAAACAVTRGGYLAEINNQAEQDSIYNRIINGAFVSSTYTSVSDGGGIAYVWIGGSDQNGEGTWLWDGNGDNLGINLWNGEGAAGLNNGSPVSGLYNNWGGASTGTPNEPDDFNNNQDGMAIALAGWPANNPGLLGITAEWNDINSNNQLYFVIEYECIRSYNTINVESCNSYTSPSGNYIWETSGIYLDVISCDSAITINLTINDIDTTVIQNGVNLTANSINSSYQWFSCENFTQVTTDTNQIFIAPKNGSYGVIIYKDGCIDTSTCYNINSVSISKGSFENEIKIYPTPTNKDISIDLGSQYSEVLISIIDIHGNVIQKQTFNESQLLNIEINKPNGMYLLKINTPNKQALFNIIKI